MQQRFDIWKIQPQAFKAALGLENYIAASALKKSHKELLKIRASQINGCAYCINMHTQDALKAGETNQRIFLLNAWRETNLYDEEEQAVLALTEEVTLIHQHGVSDEVYNRAEAIFGREYVAQLIMAIVAINTWNRISVATRKEPDQ